MFSVSSNDLIFQGLIFFKVHKIMNPQTAKLRNPAHRRPWLKMRIEYHPALIFYAFGRGFLKSQVCTHSVAEFHREVSKMVFSPQGNDNFHAFLK